MILLGFVSEGDNGWVLSSPLINMLKNESIIIFHYAWFQQLVLK
jgi:hypothetical protein